MKEKLLAREAELIAVTTQLEEQHAWAMAHNNFDLAKAYTAGSNLILSLLGEVQRTLRIIAE